MNGSSVFAALMLAKAFTGRRPEHEAVPEPEWRPELTPRERARVYRLERGVPEDNPAPVRRLPAGLVKPTRR